MQAVFKAGKIAQAQIFSVNFLVSIGIESIFLLLFFFNFLQAHKVEMNFN